jgi:DNA-binding transcriptional ArsR family regulator
MESSQAITALSALAHPVRLSVFRLLVETGPDGLAAGEIARRAGALPNTLSANLNILSHAGLVVSHRRGRSVVYAAAYDQMTALLSFLIEDCCGGDKNACAPLFQIEAKAACCAAVQAKADA